MEEHPAPEEEPLLEVLTPLGFTVRTSQRYWQKIITKHPDLADRLEVVAATRRLNGDGFLVTAYRTDAVKEGAQIWPR